MIPHNRNLKITIQQVVNKPTENKQFIVMPKSMCEGGQESFQVIKSPPKQKKYRLFFRQKRKKSLLNYLVNKLE